MENYQVVYSTLAGDQYDKVIVPRNEGATTKTNLTGKGVRSINHHRHLTGRFAQCDVFSDVFDIIAARL